MPHPILRVAFAAAVCTATALAQQTKPQPQTQLAQADTREVDAVNENQTAIGSITKVVGTAYIIREDSELPAAVGDRLYENDSVRTTEDGQAGIVLRDDTLLSLGVSSELNLKDYAFEPLEEDYSLVAKLISGTFSYVSGAIAKLAPDAVELETPVGIVAVRGTKLYIWLDPDNRKKPEVREENP